MLSTAILLLGIAGAFICLCGNWGDEDEKKRRQGEEGRDNA